VKTSRERKQLLQCLGIHTKPSEFWERFSEVHEPLDKIAVLTDGSPTERENIITILGQLLELDPSSKWWEYLEIAFHNIASYLSPVTTGNTFADEYFYEYTRCRVRDQISDKLTKMVGEWANEQLLWDYPSRSNVVANNLVEGTKVLWIDAMGAEWTGLLSQKLSQAEGIAVDTYIAKGNLPTTTEYNKEWGPGEDVERGLDDIGHHYAYQYPRSFLKEMDIIDEVAKKALDLVTHYPEVIITSDHGLSRFTAKSDEKVEATEEMDVQIPGRYATVPDDFYEENRGVWLLDKSKAVLLTHARFKRGGACHGEAHGGATPEEYLTPGIIIRRTGNQSLPQFTLTNSRAKLSAKGEGPLIFECSQQVTNVEHRVIGKVFVGRKGSGLTWSVSLKDWASGKYKGKLFCSKKFIGDFEFEVVKGIIQDDLGI
jgi:hypothetical protein